MAPASESWWELPSSDEVSVIQFFEVPATPTDYTLSLSLIHTTYQKEPLLVFDFVPYLKDFSFPWPAVIGYLLKSSGSYYIFRLKIALVCIIQSTIVGPSWISPLGPTKVSNSLPPL